MGTRSTFALFCTSTAQPNCEKHHLHGIIVIGRAEKHERIFFLEHMTHGRNMNFFLSPCLVYTCTYTRPNNAHKYKPCTTLHYIHTLHAHRRSHTNSFIYFNSTHTHTPICILTIHLLGQSERDHQSRPSFCLSVSLSL